MSRDTTLHYTTLHYFITLHYATLPSAKTEGLGIENVHCGSSPYTSYSEPVWPTGKALGW